MRKEIWKFILGYEGIYQVSNYGRVRSVANEFSRKEKILSLQKNEKGYLCVCLKKLGIGKRFKVHRLVAEAFIPNPENKPEVNHIGKKPNKQDNRVWKIEWSTKEENNKHAIESGLYHTTAKITSSQALEIFLAKGKAKEICLNYGVTVNVIYSIKRGDSWSHVTGIKKIDRTRRNTNN